MGGGDTILFDDNPRDSLAGIDREYFRSRAPRSECRRRGRILVTEPDAHLARPFRGKEVLRVTVLPLARISLDISSSKRLRPGSQAFLWPPEGHRGQGRLRIQIDVEPPPECQGVAFVGYQTLGLGHRERVR